MTNCLNLCTSVLKVLLHINGIHVDVMAFDTGGSVATLHHPILRQSDSPKSTAILEVKVRHDNPQSCALRSRMQLSSHISTCSGSMPLDMSLAAQRGASWIAMVNESRRYQMRPQ